MTLKNAQAVLYYPLRCEYVSCTSTTNLKQCQSCHFVQYCSKDHLLADMDIHDKDCDALARVNFKPIYYTDEEMLAKYPLQTRKSKRELKRLNKRKNLKEMGCCICGEHEDDMTITDCCGLPICDTEDSYQMFSYSRDICPRSHSKYTHCGGMHGRSEFCEEDKDWRECLECLSGLSNDRMVNDTLWRGLNAYNAVPLLASRVPKHSLCLILIFVKYFYNRFVSFLMSLHHTFQFESSTTDITFKWFFC